MLTAAARRGIPSHAHHSVLAGAASAVPVTLHSACSNFRFTAATAAVVNHNSMGHKSSTIFTMASCSSPAQRRGISTSPRKDISSSDRRPSTMAEDPEVMATTPAFMDTARAPLSVLPLAMILRSLATTTVSSSPLLLPPSLRVMGLLANTTNPILSPDQNPLLRFFLKNTFYAQFCAGENAVEVRSSIQGLKNIGFNGVILGYAKEVVLSKAEVKNLSGAQQGVETEDCIRNEIAPWAQGTMETVRLASPGDFVALKFTGAGRLALYQLQNRLPCSPYMAQSIDAICQLAQKQGVKLLFDAEQDALQLGIDDWTLEYMQKYNTDPENIVIYGTYQAYKKCMPQIISQHLAAAQANGFSLGVKLVRGAYINSDPRHLFHDTQEGTDACYDSIAASVLTRQWSATVAGQGQYPASAIVLATHNAESVRRARAICDAGAAKSPVAFAQLQGMADEVSCELVEASTQRKKTKEETAAPAAVLPAYKYLVWGSTGECMKYLLRRAQENKDAVQRTRSGRDAMFAELVRRVKVAVGLTA